MSIPTRIIKTRSLIIHNALPPQILQKIEKHQREKREGRYTKLKNTRGNIIINQGGILEMLVGIEHKKPKKQQRPRRESARNLSILS
jgi:hypothetical protein